MEEMNITPKISVVMPVYNGEKYLQESIESILNQTFRDFEFILINDGSKDSSLNIIKEYRKKDNRIVILDQQNTGLVKALNNGIAIAKGKYIARMDDDDISFKNRLEVQINFMEEKRDYVAISAQVEIVDKNGAFLSSTKLPTNWNDIKDYLPNNPFIHPMAFFKRDSFLKVGGYDSRTNLPVEDQILWNKMALEGKLGNIPFTLGKYRINENSISINRDNKVSRYINNNITEILNNSSFRFNKSIFEGKRGRLNLLVKKTRYYNFAGKKVLEGKIKIKRIKVLRYLFLSVIWYPFNFNSWFNILLLCLPQSWITKWKAGRYK